MSKENMLRAALATKQLIVVINQLKIVGRMVQTDSEILIERIRGLNRITAAINDLSIYVVFYGNYPELVKVLEHAKDHVKAELNQKERLEVLYYPSNKMTVQRCYQ